MSRPVTVNIPHSLGKEEARRRIEAGFGGLEQQMTGGVGKLLSLRQRWDGDVLHFEGGGLGQSITGRVTVLADQVQIQLDLPALLAMAAERIAVALKKEGQKLLERK